MVAFDVRATGILGITLLHRVSPFVGLALFGGPVLFNGDTAGDAHHYEVLGGCSVALVSGLDLFVEGSPLGERSLTGGLGVSF